MTVLCDKQIEELIHIDPFQKNEHRSGTVSYGVSSYGYDVRVGSKFKIFTNATTGGVAVIDPKRFNEDLFVSVDTTETGSDHIIIPPNSFALGVTVPDVTIRDNLVSSLEKSVGANQSITMIDYLSNVKIEVYYNR